VTQQAMSKEMKMAQKNNLSLNWLELNKAWRKFQLLHAFKKTV